jgi:hypothetical protein
MGRGSSVGIATRYGLEDDPGSNPGRGEIFRTRPDRPWGLPSPLYNGYQVFSGVKGPRRGADHPPPSKCRGHERVGLYLYSPSGPQWPVIGRTFTIKQTARVFVICTWINSRINNNLYKVENNYVVQTYH